MIGKIAAQFIQILALFLILSCQQDRPYDRTVANIGNEQIKLSDFLYSFTLSPHFRPNSSLKEARLQHLDYMQDRVLMTMAAEKEQLDTIPEIENRIRYIREKEILKFLYGKEILGEIEVSDEEAWHEYKRSNIQVHLRHIFAPTKKKASEYYDRLQNGETFEQLAREAFTNQQLAESGGDLGFVSINDLDPFLADSVYTQRLNQISRPLRSGFGYHIVRVEDIKQNIFLSETDFQSKKDQMVKAVKARRAKKLSSEYLADVLKGKSVTIKKEILNELLDLSSTHIRVKDPSPELPFLAPKVTDNEIEGMMSDGNNLLDETLVIFDDGSWTVWEFLKRLIYTPPLQRPSLNKQNVVSKRIIDMVRDELLLQEAYRKGYHKKEEVKEAIKKWRDELLADEFRKRIEWVAYKKQDEEEWARRRLLFQKLKEETPIKINQEILFQDVSEAEMQKRQDPIHIVLREQYKW